MVLSEVKSDECEVGAEGKRMRSPAAIVEYGRDRKEEPPLAS